MDATGNLGSKDLDSLIPDDVTIRGGLSNILNIFVGSKMMLRFNINVKKVNSNMGFIPEIIWPCFPWNQLYNILSVQTNFGLTRIHIIKPIFRLMVKH